MYIKNNLFCFRSVFDNQTEKLFRYDRYSVQFKTCDHCRGNAYGPLKLDSIGSDIIIASVLRLVIAEKRVEPKT